MLASVEFDYYSSNEKVFKAMGREAYEKLRSQVDHIDLPEWDPEKDAPPLWYQRTAIIDLSSDGVVLTAAGLKFTIKRFKGTYKVDAPDGGTHSHLHIAIPAIGLLAMDEVKLLSDACTDELNEFLHDGWRIIAVCPPDAQRRPDYILGRSPEMRRAL